MLILIFTRISILSQSLLLFLVSLCTVLFASEPTDVRSPYFQDLPDCSTKNFTRRIKKSPWKGIVCPMIKDEIGFLAEWTAFHEMMGFDHVIFFDNNSTTSLSELDPWINSGFAEIVGNNAWWEHDKALRHSLSKGNSKRRFYDMMRVKYLSEVYCKRRAVEMGYDIFVSLDIDEYLFPTSSSMTAMDEIMDWFQSTKRRIMALPKFNFNPTPHFLEPLNLLTIEAFLTRMKEKNRMNYYKTISPKVALWLSDRNGSTADFSNKTIEYMIHCCDFHGCGNFAQHRACGDSLKDERWHLEGKHLKWKPGLHLHHYARSMEKFMLKQRTWDTASGESSRGYDFYNFLDRTPGFTYDDSALSWTCQLRELLANRTGVQHFVRTGDFWYRNPEFGRTVSDASKRGRNGAGFGKYLGPWEMNPYPPGSTYQSAHRPYDASERNARK